MSTTASGKPKPPPPPPRPPPASPGAASPASLREVAPFIAAGAPIAAGASSRFDGERTQQYVLWAHNMALLSGCALIVLGGVACLWARSGGYRCQVDEGDPISRHLIKANVTVGGVVGQCLSSLREACCDPDDDEQGNVGGSILIGLICIFAGLTVLILEKFLGLWNPGKDFFYTNKVSLNGCLILILGLPAYATYATVMAGFMTTASAAVYHKSARRQEAGDGGRSTPAKKQKWSTLAEWRAWSRSISAMWTLAYLGVNVIIFIYVASVWADEINVQSRKLKNDGLKLDDCDDCPGLSTREYSRWRTKCHLNKALVRHGPLSRWAPLAKACGVCLNFNCALLLLPVTKTVLNLLNEASGSYSDAQRRSAIFKRIFVSPLARYIPVSRNVDAHKLIAKTMAALAGAHTMAHFLNYWQAPRYTLIRFAKWGWAGTPFLTGGLIVLAMFFIFSASTDAIRRANFEIFYYAHHFFIVYYLMLLLHGPVFYLWSVFPISLYVFDRISQKYRGRTPMLVTRVEWVEPVLALHFRPVDLSDFDFDEGMYVTLNCPFISEHQWHPFTISSARGDLVSGRKLVSLHDGSFVTETSHEGKRVLQAADGSPLERHEVAYHDFISCHIKVNTPSKNGVKTWTSKLKDYLEMMAPNPKQKYPMHLTRRDDRGDLHLGRRLGPDSRPIIRVSGPYSSPAAHYRHYGTVMIIGAGIGMTPCASIVTALLRYRWRKNFKPEIVHFYWILQHGDVASFEWFISLLAELEEDLQRARESGAVSPRNYIEIHCFVTRAPSPQQGNDDLLAELLSPSVAASEMVVTMLDKEAKNRFFQDVWVWNGRPRWDGIFAEVKAQRQHRDIGVLFCGNPAVGADLAAQCKKHSESECLFTLHKENF